MDPNKCPNTVYVACTRASERLSVIHHYKHYPFSFLDINTVNELCETIDTTAELPKPIFDANLDLDGRPLNVSVTELLKHTNENILNEVLDMVTVETIQPASERIALESKTKQGRLIEEVSEINGVAIPSYFDLSMNGKISIIEDLVMKKH